MEFGVHSGIESGRSIAGSGQDQMPASGNRTSAAKIVLRFNGLDGAAVRELGIGHQ